MSVWSARLVAGTATSPFRGNHLAREAGWRSVSSLLMYAHIILLLMSAFDPKADIDLIG
jgi:hypothetical protein